MNFQEPIKSIASALPKNVSNTIAVVIGHDYILSALPREIYETEGKKLVEFL